MKKICFVALAALALSACNSEPKFKVEGEVSGADGKMLYLEAAALEGIVPLDSEKLKGDGSFSFKQIRPVSPEFYRLRVDDKVINFSVDSTETIGLKAPYTDFATAYTVEGSANSTKIKELTLKQVQLQNEVNELVKKMQAHQIGADVFEEKLATLMKDYKDEVKTKYIFAAPNTAAAYFALFQKLNNYLIFDPLIFIFSIKVIQQEIMGSRSCTLVNSKVQQHHFTLQFTQLMSIAFHITKADINDTGFGNSFFRQLQNFLLRCTGILHSLNHNIIEILGTICMRIIIIQAGSNGCKALYIILAIQGIEDKVIFSFWNRAK